jgi:hypothetical protein
MLCVGLHSSAKAKTEKKTSAAASRCLVMVDDNHDTLRGKEGENYRFRGRRGRASVGSSVVGLGRRNGDIFGMSTAQRRVMTAIKICRTAALGGTQELESHCSICP